MRLIPLNHICVGRQCSHSFCCACPGACTTEKQNGKAAPSPRTVLLLLSSPPPPTERAVSPGVATLATSSPLPMAWLLPPLHDPKTAWQKPEEREETGGGVRATE